MTVYFIQRKDTGLIKIGHSIQPETRRIALQFEKHTKMKILATVPGGQAGESLLQRYFAHLRVEGEWFQPANELLDFIAYPRPFAEIAESVGVKMGRARRLTRATR